MENIKELEVKMKKIERIQKAFTIRCRIKEQEDRDFKRRRIKHLIRRYKGEPEKILEILGFEFKNGQRES